MRDVIRGKGAGKLQPAYVRELKTGAWRSVESVNPKKAYVKRPREHRSLRKDKGGNKDPKKSDRRKAVINGTLAKGGRGLMKEGEGAQVSKRTLKRIKYT